MKQYSLINSNWTGDSLFSLLYVYAVGLNAVQFGKKLDEKFRGQRKFGCQRNFFNPIISTLDKHEVLLLINYID